MNYLFLSNIKRLNHGMVFKFLVFSTFLMLAFPNFPVSEHSAMSVPGESENRIEQLYALINDSTINPVAFKLAMTGYRSLKAKGIVPRKNLITIIDYSRPSDQDRFYVIDLATPSIVLKTLVAHGRNSGELYASRFSNKPQSNQSALGFYITGNTYTGGQGYSLLMSGVDTGFNDNARLRSIVIHGASYATYSYIERYGRLGRSLGCPALPPEVNDEAIDLIKAGSVVFGYYPDNRYLSGSKILTSLPAEHVTDSYF